MIKSPPLKYNGGKWMAGKWIISHFPIHRTYLEPFFGSGSILLQKDPSKYEFCNDLDQNVFTFFKVLRNNYKELIRAIDFTPYHEDEFKQSILPNSKENEIEIARQFYVRTWQGRTNNLSSNNFRIVVNNYSGGYIPSNMMNKGKNLLRVAKRLKKVHFLNRDYKDILTKFDKEETFVYLDPPYFCERSKMYDHELRSESDHIEFIENILRLKYCKIMISGYSSDLYDSAFKNWESKTKDVLSDGKTSRKEKIWMNYEIQQNLFV